MSNLKELLNKKDEKNSVEEDFNLGPSFTNLKILGEGAYGLVW